MHWCEKRTAVAVVAHALSDRGFTLYGYKPDKSELMTDYFDPATWRGVAEKNGTVVCVNVDEHTVKSCSGGVTRRRPERTGDCDNCEGSGEDPSGWTLAEARENPRAYNADTAPTGAVAMLPDVVSPLPFGSDGKLKCRVCKGDGGTYKTVEYVEPWPEFRANPKGCNWHVERNGVVVDKGKGVFTAGRDVTKLDKLLNRVERVCGTPSENASSEPEPVEGVTVRPGKREGYVEVVFPDKPSAEVRSELKEARFRWSRANGCWYGKEEKLPERYCD